MEFTFDEVKHEYYLDGKKMMAVSDFIRPLSDSPDNIYLETAFEVAAERGVVGHKIVELLLNDEDIDGEYPSEYEPYIDAVRLFISEHSITPIYMETPFYSKELGIAGTPDLICLFDDVTAIIDYKFVSTVQKSKISAQLNAYYLICQENGIDVDALYCVHFRNDGNYAIYPTSICRKDVDELVKLHERKNRKHPRGRID